MGGGLIQLVAYGSQDIYLSSNPQITFFKSVFKRHTHFSIESIYQAIDGNTNFGGSISIVIGRNGDLLGSIYLEVQLPDANDFKPIGSDYDFYGWIQGIGNYLVDTATIFIGGQQIDEQFGKWMDIWSQLTLRGSQVDGYGTMVGKDFSAKPFIPYDVTISPGNRLYIPLQFWFCRNPGLAIPIIALQYHEMKINIRFEKYNKLFVAVKNGNYVNPVINDDDCLPPKITSVKLYSTYYFLDTTERRKFVQNPHEYLIEQTQNQKGNVTSITEENTIRLNFNNPTKELIFIFNKNNSFAPQNDFSIGTNKIPLGTPKEFSPLYNAKLVINGHDRFTIRHGEYFRLVQPYDHHTRISSEYIYTYSFSIRPEEHQPSGTCNFTRIDNSLLVFNLRTSDCENCCIGSRDGNPEEDYTTVPSYTIWAPCYNILRIMGGMAGLAYNS